MMLEEHRFLEFAKGIKSRVLPDDREFVKNQIANAERNVCVKKLPDEWDHEDLF